MAFAKCQENRFRIDGEIAENHVILVNLTASIYECGLNENLNNFASDRRQAGAKIYTRMINLTDPTFCCLFFTLLI